MLWDSTVKILIKGLTGIGSRKRGGGTECYVLCLHSGLVHNVLIVRGV